MLFGFGSIYYHSSAPLFCERLWRKNVSLSDRHSLRRLSEEMQRLPGLLAPGAAKEKAAGKRSRGWLARRAFFNLNFKQRFVFDLALVLAMVLDTWVLLAIMASSEPLCTKSNHATDWLQSLIRASEQLVPHHTSTLRTWMFRL